MIPVIKIQRFNIFLNTVRMKNKEKQKAIDEKTV